LSRAKSIVDLSNLDLIDKSIFYGENKLIGAKLRFTDLNGNLLVEKVYNDIVYRRIAQERKGGVDVFRGSRYILIQKDSKQIPGKLNFENVLIQK